MSGAAVHAAPPDSRGSDDLASSVAANSARTPDQVVSLLSHHLELQAAVLARVTEERDRAEKDAAAARERERKLAESSQAQIDVLREVDQIADDLRSRPHDLVSPLTIAARLRIALGRVALPEVAAASVQPGAGGEGER